MALFSLLFLAGTANTQTEILSNAYFDIYYPSSRGKVAEQVSVIGTAELERISRNLKQTMIKRITISILEQDDYQEQYGDHLPEWGVAFAIPEKNRILLIFPGSFNKPSRLQFIIAHEIAHLLIHKRAATFVPRWFDEGMAMYLSREPSIIDELQLLLAVAIGGIIPLQELSHSFPETGRRARLAYMESLSTIVFLSEDFGTSSGVQILDATRETGDFRAGFIKATGIDLPQFEMEWRAWIRKRFALAVILRPNVLFAAAALFVLIAGILAKLRAKKASTLNEGIEE
jgi:hypothetical protein